MKNILATVFLVFAAQVLAESNTDVIESFGQIYEKFHQDIDDIQASSHSLAQQLANRLQATVYHVQDLLVQDQYEARVALHQQLQDMLTTLNLSPNNEDVKKCIADSDAAVEKMILRSEGGLQVCKTTEGDEVSKVTELLNNVYLKQAKEHRDLEETKLQCNSTAQSPAQLRNCLEYQLFIVHVDLIKEVKEETEQIMKNYESVLDTAGINLLDCSNIVKRNILDEVAQIVLQFHYCCYDILGVRRNI